ncbi:hypothetical protein MCOR25_009349 [Pyricularia grisea]|nr:hypothetical protein MCOR25_009349 [Pyricularia grisea]
MDKVVHATSLPILPGAIMSKNDAPEVEQLFKENGRLYQVWPRDRYLLPADQTEQDRLDIFSQLFKIVLNNKLHTDASKVEENSHVLDLGCGTGLWVILMAHELHPKPSLFIGADVQMTQPDLIPATVRFTPADIEAAWTEEMVQHAPYDLINCRLMKGAIRSWPALYEKIAAHLKPETGVFEQFEIDWQFRCDDGPIPPALKQWSDEVMQAMDQHGMSIRCNREETRSMLLNHGFDDVQEQAIVLPISNWADDERGREIGRWFNLALNHSTLPMSLAPLFRVMKKTPQYIDELNKAASREVCSQAHTDGVYCMLYIWTARTRPSRRR